MILRLLKCFIVTFIVILITYSIVFVFSNSQYDFAYIILIGGGGVFIPLFFLINLYNYYIYKNNNRFKSFGNQFILSASITLIGVLIAILTDPRQLQFKDFLIGFISSVLFSVLFTTVNYLVNRIEKKHLNQLK